MLRKRHLNNILAESLGPPLRLTSTENEEAKIGEKSIKRPASSRRPPLRSTSLASARAAISQGKENRYHSGTPLGRPALSSNRDTPNSTYPNSMCDSTDSVNKSVSLLAGVGAQTPSSSTFPTTCVSLPITGDPNTQQRRRQQEDVNAITEPDGSTVSNETDEADSSHENGERGVEEIGTDRVSSKVIGANMNRQISNDRGTPIETDLSRNDRILSGEADVIRRGSNDRGIPTSLSVAAVATNRPPSAPSQPNMPIAVNSQPLNQESEDIVTLASGVGEMRFKRLKLLGCGGSSKVSKIFGRLKRKRE